jgi:flagellar biosynthetic protein FliR
VIDLTPLARIGLLLVRPGFLIGGSPLFASTFAPTTVKIGLTMFVALALFPSTPIPPAGESIAVAMVVAREAAIGIALALATRVLIAGAEFAGHLAGFQMGLSYGAVVDPSSGVRNNMIAALYGNIAVITLLATNGHHVFLRALHESYTSLPIGGGHIGASLPQTVILLLGLLFNLGTRMAAPIIIVLLITEVAMGLLARSAPSLNVMVAGPSMRVLIGLGLLMLVAPTTGSVVATALGDVVRLATQAAGAFR